MLNPALDRNFVHDIKNRDHDSNIITSVVVVVNCYLGLNA